MAIIEVFSMFNMARASTKWVATLVATNLGWKGNEKMNFFSISLYIIAMLTIVGAFVVAESGQISRWWLVNVAIWSTAWFIGTLRK